LLAGCDPAGDALYQHPLREPLITFADVAKTDT
jgi:hypothetical protein